MTAQQRTSDELRHVFPMRRNRMGIPETVWTALCGYADPGGGRGPLLRCPTCARLSGDPAPEVERLERLVAEAAPKGSASDA